MTTLTAARMAPRVVYPPTMSTPRISPKQLTEGSVFVAVASIMDAACHMLCVPRERVVDSTRHEWTVFARRLIIACAKKHTQASYPDIVKVIRDKTIGHSMAIEAHQRFDKLLHEPITVRGVTHTHAEWLFLLERRLGLVTEEYQTTSPC